MNKYQSHETRLSDASSFDEACVKCGATDIAGIGWGKLSEPSPGTSSAATTTEGYVVVPIAELVKLEQARLQLYDYFSHRLSQGDLLILPNITGQIWRVANMRDWGDKQKGNEHRQAIPLSRESNGLMGCPFCGVQPLSHRVSISAPGMEDCSYWSVECPNCNGSDGRAFVGANAGLRSVAESVWNGRVKATNTEPATSPIPSSGPYTLLNAPLTPAQLREGENTDGYVTGAVSVSPSDLIDNDLEGVLDILSERLTGTDLLEDISYRVIGAADDMIHVEVTGNPVSVLELVNNSEAQRSCSNC